MTHAKRSFSKLGIEENRYGFLCSDVFDYLPLVEPGQFDTILCFGFFYHTARHVELLREIKRIKPKHFIIDTEVDYVFLDKVTKFRSAKALDHLDSILKDECGESIKEFLDFVVGRSYSWFGSEDSRKESNTIDSINLVARPSHTCFRLMLKQFGFEASRLNWEGAGVRDWTNLEHYRDGTRVSYRADLEAVPETKN